MCVCVRVCDPLSVAARPMAATTMSALRTTSSRFFVLEWHMVTVASRLNVGTTVTAQSDHRQTAHIQACWDEMTDQSSSPQLIVNLAHVSKH